MRKLTIFFVLISFVGCHHAVDIKLKKLQDSIEVLRKKIDYRPMDSAEAYDFINKYYLPRLDTLKTKRRLSLYPASGRNFKALFLSDSITLTKKYRNETIPAEVDTDFFKELYPNIHSTWNQKRFINTTLITDTIFSNQFISHHKISIKEITAWHKKFGFGYTCISYPLYNANTKRIYMYEVSVHSVGAIDGNTSEKGISFQKKATSWQEY
jgi:hypothetical protein